MKNLFILISILLALNSFANELQWVDEQVQAIKPPRSGVKTSTINSVSNPFLFVKEKSGKNAKSSKAKTALNKTSSNKNQVSKKSKALVLNAIINKSALINGKWYKIKDKVGKYTLSSIERNTVILKYKTKELFLSTNTQTKNLKFKNK